MLGGDNKRRNTMVRISNLLAIIVIAVILVGCASRPAPRPMYIADVPLLERGMSRLKITSGKWMWTRLWAVGQVGPVFINDRQIWSSAIDEYIIVDLLPGIYEISWTPGDPDAYKVFTEKRKVTLEAGEIRHFACDMAQKGAGMHFGLIGALASEYLTKTYLEERPMDNPDSILVAYKVLNEEQNVPKSATITTEHKAQPSSLKNEKPSIDDNSIYARLEKLKKMYESQLITKEEYDLKRQKLVNDF